MNRQSSPPCFAAILQDFFCRYLIDQRNLSAETVASYRDTFRLLLNFIRKHRGREPASLTLPDLDACLVLEFLQHLEQDRGNLVRTRNVRLAAIRSFAKYAALRDPASLADAQALLAIPLKRADRKVVGYLSRAEMESVLQAPDPTTWSGRRDRVMFATFYNTGARVSEITRLQVTDVELERSRTVRLHGKGRKERVIPIWKATAQQLHEWVQAQRATDTDPVFPNRKGRMMTRSGVEYRLRRAVTVAAKTCPSLAERNVSPHTLRHTTAMHLLQSGVAPTVIALWLGHESPTTTHIYVEADLAMKERALATLQEPSDQPVRYSPPDDLLAFLESL